VHAADSGVQCLDVDMASDLEPTAIDREQEP
jgi:hypothetical protein